MPLTIHAELEDAIRADDGRGYIMGRILAELDAERAAHQETQARLDAAQSAQQYKHYVNGCITTLIQENPTLNNEWGGDRTGWGFVFEWIKWVAKRAIATEKQLAETWETPVIRCAHCKGTLVWKRVNGEFHTFHSCKQLAETQAITRELAEALQETRQYSTKATAALAKYAEAKTKGVLPATPKVPPSLGKISTT